MSRNPYGVPLDHAIPTSKKAGYMEVQLRQIREQLDDWIEYFQRAETFAAAFKRSNDPNHPMVYLDDVLRRFRRLREMAGERGESSDRK